MNGSSPAAKKNPRKTEAATDRVCRSTSAKPMTPRIVAAAFA